MIVFLFVEGYYDKLFFENVLKKIDFCVDINVQEYAQKQPSRINDYLKSIVKSGNVYILIADLDPEQYQSSAERVSKLRNLYTSLDEGNVIIVEPEIEAWYVAGLSKGSKKRLGIKISGKLESCTKEKFKNTIGKKRDNTDFRMEILENFDVEIAKKNSKSFKEFVELFSNICKPLN